MCISEHLPIMIETEITVTAMHPPKLILLIRSEMKTALLNLFIKSDY